MSIRRALQVAGRLRLRPRRGERGQSMVEFALAAPVLITFVFGTVEVANAAHNYMVVLGAARDAARLGARGGTDADLKALITVESADLPAPAIPVNTSCAAGTVAGVCIVRGSVPGPSSVKVQVCYDHPLIVGLPAFLPNPMLMCSATTMRVLTGP